MKRAGLFAFFFLLAGRGFAQQPFATDDAEITPLRHWHFEYANQFAVLQKADYPNLRQDVSNFVFQYGLFEHVEVDLDFPVIGIFTAGDSGLPSAFGLGDLDFAVKWNFVREAPDGARPAFTVSFAAEFPTGSEKKQLGSGLTDYVLNTIAQKTFGETALHVNAGIQFSGNTRTGLVGIRTPGRILTGGLSASREFSKTLLLGIDLNGAEIHDGGRVEKQLQLTAGGSYALFREGTLDFAIVTGWYSGPRFGIVLGFSITPFWELIWGNAKAR